MEDVTDTRLACDRQSSSACAQAFVVLVALQKSMVWKQTAGMVPQKTKKDFSNCEKKSETRRKSNRQNSRHLDSGASRFLFRNSGGQKELEQSAYHLPIWPATHCADVEPLLKFSSNKVVRQMESLTKSQMAFMYRCHYFYLIG